MTPKEKPQFTALPPHEQEALANRMVHLMQQRQELLEIARGKPPYKLLIAALIALIVIAAVGLANNVDSGSMAVACLFILFIAISIQVRSINDRLNAMVKLLLSDISREISASAEPAK